MGRHAEPWTVTLVDTGTNSGTGGRLKRVRDLIGDERFLDDASPWSLGLILVLPLAPLDP